MTSYQPSAELRLLIDRLLDDGPLGRADLARLEELLEDDAALDYYIEVTQQEAAMLAVAGETQAPPVTGRTFRWGRVAWQAAAAAAIFAIGYFAAPTKIAPTVGTVPPPVKSAPAKITGMVGVRWTDGAPPDLIGTAGGVHRLEIESGLLEITYASGVRVTLEGPARYGVTGPASGLLDSGKLVTAVPKGAEGFRIDYPDGQVVDLGTEFAMEVKEGESSEVGVFDGEVELRRDGKKPMALYENHAVRQTAGQAGEPLQPVPLDRAKYVRRIPSREFAWEITSEEPREMEFDVSHLLWKASAYRAVFRWINGVDGVAVSDVELRLDGEKVSADHHRGVTGYGPPIVSDNIYRLDVPAGMFRSGKWTLHARVETLPRDRMGDIGQSPIQSQGILQFEEGLVTTAEPADFVGKWSYRYMGDHFVREFLPDGTAMLTKNGQDLPGCFAGCRWTVKDGILSITMPGTTACEEHILRDRDTLIFINQNYENASRVAPESESGTP
ncbi:MAG: FecR domain-containing protein [Verrucomicrobia bacterium]|nr:FecR domain-containing protein [Verrucomicrobiota bacterium]